AALHGRHRISAPFPARTRGWNHRRRLRKASGRFAAHAHWVRLLPTPSQPQCDICVSGFVRRQPKIFHRAFIENSLDMIVATRQNGWARGHGARCGGTMPSYQICYFDDHGSLTCTLSAMCESETQAKVLAHAMKLSDYKTFEVWHERTLV